MSGLPKTMRAMQIQEQGPVDVLEVRDDVPLPDCGPDEVIIKVEWAGINFIDTYQRGGVYKIATPAVLGNETAGTIAKLGSNVKPSQYGFDVGDRVAAYHALTGFAQYSRSTARSCVKLPDGVTTKLAATALLQGLTALSFVTEAHEVKTGEYILIHAAAGALGQILCQLCKARGAHVIGTTSTEAKAETARKAGAEHVVLYKDVPMDQVAQQVRKLTPNEAGVAAVFDGVGKDTFDMNFDCLARKGSLVSCGNASGAVPPVAPLRLGAKNLKLSRPVLTHYVATQEEFQSYAAELFGLLQRGELVTPVHKIYDFSTDGFRSAHNDLSSRATTGKLLVKIDAQ